MPATITIGHDHVTHLYVKLNHRLAGAVRMYYGDLYGMWSGVGSLAMDAHVEAGGAYEVALCCSALADGVKVRVEAGGEAVGGVVDKTWGPWPKAAVTDKANRSDYNFERVKLRGALALKEGPLTLTIHVTGPAKLPEKALNVVSVELTPVAAKAALAAGEARAMTHRADPAWFVQAGYGLMFHWQPHRETRAGVVRPCAKMANDFDVNRWAAMCEATGARYVFLTLNHGFPNFPGPLKYWERMFPGWTQKRDLVGDMADALAKRGLRMCGYLNCPTFGRLPTRRSMKQYVDVNCRMFEEVGRYYGDRLAAYWLDSFYQPYIKWGHLDIHRLFAASKTGYKDRMVGFNQWAFPVPTRAQDYWCGEVYQSLVQPPRTPYFHRGAAAGLLYHALYSPDCHWGRPKIVDGKIVEKPIWPAEVFADYLTQCLHKGGVVTINLGSFDDGSISPFAARWMTKIRRLVRGG